MQTPLQDHEDEPEQIEQVNAVVDNDEFLSSPEKPDFNFNEASQDQNLNNIDSNLYEMSEESARVIMDKGKAPAEKSKSQ